MIACVLNQSKSHWLLFDKLLFALIMCLKFKEDIINPSTPINLINDDSRIAFELFCVLSTLEKKFAVFWILFFLFLKKIEKRETHNTLSLMLDLRFKNLRLIFYFVGQEEGVSIVDEYDKRILYPMFLKCYHHLHPMTLFIGCVN